VRLLVERLAKEVKSIPLSLKTDFLISENDGFTIGNASDNHGG
jgi:hypothetical protein